MPHGKGKVVPVFIYKRCHEDVCGSGGIAPLILKHFYTHCVVPVKKVLSLRLFNTCDFFFTKMWGPGFDRVTDYIV